MMPAVCHFYGYTPDQFYEMDIADTNRLLVYMHEFQKAQRDALNQ